MSNQVATQQVRTPAKAWVMLGLGVAAQATGTLLVSTPAYLIPLLHSDQGMPLAQAGLLAAAPTFGMVLTLVLWGAAADRFGERWVIAGGLALTALFAFAAVPADGYAWLTIVLVLGGAASASTNSASGRIVVGWFPRERRGLAMGIRQMSQPLGVAVAALTVPALASGYGLAAPFVLSGAAALVLAVLCAWGIRNPPRPSTPVGAAAAGTANPYTRDRFLLRIHVVSALLVFPQFTLSTFGLVWLTAGMGWNATAAGLVVAASQFVGALGRIVIGHLSDRLGTRVGVLRWVAIAGVVAMVLLGAAGWAHWDIVAAALFVIAATISVADNGLAFTSVAEAAGRRWSGRALGIQNTGQFVSASVVGPVVGALITAVGFPLAFGLVAVTPLLALGILPARDQHWDEPAGPR
ncbi:MFS transporter [Microbacterium kyungheense]|uniref:Sugar phosphate permease n=1 Tax=Microbacterium kyungheense TaxID=1263636 RepID=A0A543F191_9MICO|nr:MFS transporter [Microbacterium kyungheense]TQM27581.1 sugar phosphate permease [Microbacterium kyungheense]